MKTILMGYVKIATWSPMDGMFSGESFYNDMEELKRTCDPTEIVLPPNTQYTLVINYPVSVDYFRLFLTGSNGMTRSKLANFICRSYRRMYEEETRTSKVKESKFEGSMTRNHTKGSYGIWGHHIEDLTLICVTIDGDIIKPIIE